MDLDLCVGLFILRVSHVGFYRTSKKGTAYEHGHVLSRGSKPTGKLNFIGIYCTIYIFLYSETPHVVGYANEKRDLIKVVQTTLTTCDWKRPPTVFYHDPFEQ